MDLYATCYNLKRLINLEPMDLLLLKVQNWGKTSPFLFTYQNILIKTSINVCL